MTSSSITSKPGWFQHPSNQLSSSSTVSPSLESSPNQSSFIALTPFHHPHIAEGIFLDCDYFTLKACRGVNRLWRGILDEQERSDTSGKGKPGGKGVSVKDVKGRYNHILFPRGRKPIPNAHDSGDRRNNRDRSIPRLLPEGLKSPCVQVRLKGYSQDLSPFCSTNFRNGVVIPHFFHEPLTWPPLKNGTFHIGRLEDSIYHEYFYGQCGNGRGYDYTGVMTIQDLLRRVYWSAKNKKWTSPQRIVLEDWKQDVDMELMFPPNDYEEQFIISCPVPWELTRARYSDTDEEREEERDWWY